MYAKIEPISVGWPGKTADRLRVSNVRINTIGIEGNADVSWQLYSDETGSVAEGTAKLVAPAYDAWGLDDAYLLEWLARPEQLALTIVEIVRDIPVPPAPPAPVIIEEPAPVVVEEPAPVVVEEPAPVDTVAPTEPPVE